MEANLSILQPFGMFPQGDMDKLVQFRYLIEDAMAKLKQFKASLDEEIILTMKDENIKEYEIHKDDKSLKMYYAKEKKEKIKDLKYLRDSLFAEDEGRREMALNALSGSQSAWKIAKVREMADTLGLDLIDTTYSENIKIKVIDPKLLEKK